MEATNTLSTSLQVVRSKAIDYSQLIKLRLSFLVVFSATMAYLWAVDHISLVNVLCVSIGGFLITGAANILNQVIERDSDKLMKRTHERPLPSGRMQVNEALILAAVIGVAGLFLMYNISMLCAVLGAVAIVIYAGIYTPLKKITPLTVIPGAVAGSIPVVIGCVAAQGRITTEAWLLLTVQFTWQFPHTWSIAWLLEEEYKKAGINMMPAKGGRNKTSAFLIMLSTILIIPVGALFYFTHAAGIIEATLLTIVSLGFAFFACRLYIKRTVKAALGVMFGSFAYLPLVLLILVVTKIFFK